MAAAPSNRAVTPVTLAARPNTYIRVRNRIERHQRINDCLRMLERLIDATTEIDERMHERDRIEAGLVFEARFRAIVHEMEAEGMRLMLESSSLYRQATAKASR